MLWFSFWSKIRSTSWRCVGVKIIQFAIVKWARVCNKGARAGSINKVTNYPRLRSKYCCDKFYQTGDNRERSSPVKIINHHKVKIEHSQIHNILTKYKTKMDSSILDFDCTSLPWPLWDWILANNWRGQVPACTLAGLHFGGGSSVNRNKM